MSSRTTLATKTLNRVGTPLSPAKTMVKTVDGVVLVDGLPVSHKRDECLPRGLDERRKRRSGIIDGLMIRQNFFPLAPCSYAEPDSCTSSLF